MTFTVVWRPTAERSLTEIWLDAADGQAIANAADTIDALLRSSPLSVGEPGDGGARLLYVAPLAVYYDVHPEDMLVAVWALWQHRD
jgi:plasmid stabilization system protein ParE